MTKHYKMTSAKDLEPGDSIIYCMDTFAEPRQFYLEMEISSIYVETEMNTSGPQKYSLVFVLQSEFFTASEVYKPTKILYSCKKEE